MPEAGSWYKDWFNSPYYHKLYFERKDDEARGFIDRLLNKLKPASGSTILDMGCGRGTHSIYLAEKGFDVTGIDLSEDNILLAKKSETSNLSFYQHDMRLPFRINYFDYVFNFFTSFGFYRTEREHYNAIRTIASTLNKNGTLVLDYMNVHFAEDHLVHKQDKKTNGVNYFITKWFDETHFYKKIQIEDEQLDEPLEFTEKFAKLSLGDFNDMLAFHRLQVQEVFGDYFFNAYDVKKSPRLIIIAKKIMN
jgi:2-polyprenyl-3-methyl-5-hydroxy-6-metoxy-1,4-benzoquinol methylase